MTDRSLHDQLTAISDQVRPVDLYQRSLQRSNQIGRRRTVTSLAGTAVGILVILAVSWQLIGRPLAAPAPVPATRPPTPSPSPSQTPMPDPTPTPGPLDNATLRVTPWPRYAGMGGCGTGPFRLVDHEASVSGQQLTVFVWSTIELTLNGAPGYVAVVSCFGPGEGQVQQVLAYRRTSTGPALIGRAVATDGADITDFGSLTSSAANEVSVDVLKQTVPGSAPPAYSIMHQQRTYRLTGGTFRQVAGDTTFLASAAGVNLQADAFVFDPPIQGCRPGTMTLTIHNGGTQPAPDLAAVVINAPEAGECPASAGQGYLSVLVSIGTLGAGETRTVTVHAVAADSTGGSFTEDQPYYFILLRSGERQYPGSTHYLLTYE